jgi:HrpA-like RNA helicase
VHERSVDTDLLCLFARRLVQSHPTIRIILMSATISTDLYKVGYAVVIAIVVLVMVWFT